MGNKYPKSRSRKRKEKSSVKEVYGHPASTVKIEMPERIVRSEPLVILGVDTPPSPILNQKEGISRISLSDVQSSNETQVIKSEPRLFNSISVSTSNPSESTQSIANELESNHSIAKSLQNDLSNHSLHKPKSHVTSIFPKLENNILLGVSNEETAFKKAQSNTTNHILPVQKRNSAKGSKQSLHKPKSHATSILPKLESNVLLSVSNEEIAFKQAQSDTTNHSHHPMQKSNNAKASLSTSNVSMVNRISNEDTRPKSKSKNRLSHSSGTSQNLQANNETLSVHLSKSDLDIHKKMNETPISVKSLSRVSNKASIANILVDAISNKSSSSTLSNSKFSRSKSKTNLKVNEQKSVPKLTISQVLKQGGDLFYKLANGCINNREPIEINELADSDVDEHEYETTEDFYSPTTKTTTVNMQETEEIENDDDDESFDEEEGKRAAKLNLSIRSSIAEGFNIFALNLFKHLCFSERENLLFSPFNIAQGLTLCYIGAQNKTEKQLDELLNISSLNKLKNLTKAEVTNENARLKKNLKKVKQETGVLLFLNRLFAPKKVNIKTDFAEKVRKYSSSIENLDFSKRVESSNAINQEISKKFKHRIRKIAEESDLNAFGILSMNVAYFCGTWKTPFLESNTVVEEFQVAHGVTEKIEMMHQYDANYKYLENYADLNASTLLLPYAGKKFSMMIILPFEGINIASIEAKLTTSLIRGIRRKLKYEKVNVSLPKFKVKHRLELSNDIIRMGAEDAFIKNKADLTLIAEDQVNNESLYLTKFVHKVIFKVDASNNKTETNAEASTSLTDKNKTVFNFNCNKPFLYIIRDNVNRIIMFIGKFDKPYAIRKKGDKREEDQDD